MTSSRQTNTRNRDSNYTKVKSRRFKVWQIALAVLATLLVAVFVAVPLVIQNRGLVVRLINQNAGLAPMRVDLAGISGGWFRPFKVQGLRLIDDRGAELVQIAEVETELTLVSLITNYRNLRTITVRNAEVHLDVQPGTTNIEEAIKPWLAQSTPASAAKPAASGTGWAASTISMCEQAIP
jgi:hypothetical protein